MLRSAVADGITVNMILGTKLDVVSQSTVAERA